MNYANEKGKFDEEVTDKGVRLLIEPSALMHIIGTKMDFISDRLKYARHGMLMHQSAHMSEERFGVGTANSPQFTIEMLAGGSSCLSTLIRKDPAVVVSLSPHKTQKWMNFFI